MKSTKFPPYARYFFILASLLLTLYSLIILKSIVNPILLALIFAILLKPLANKMEKIKFPRLLSSIICVLLLFVVLAILILFFSTQVGNIIQELNSITESLSQFIEKSKKWAANTFGIAPDEQMEYAKNSLNNMVKSSSGFLGSTVSATAGFFTGVTVFIIAMFFFLYYRSFLYQFLIKVSNDKNKGKLNTILEKIVKVVRSYVLGLLLVILIVAILNSLGLALIGIEHAMFFGVFAAVLTVIPYIGIILGSLMPILFTLATTDSIWYPIGVALLFAGVQFVEGNFITPNVVGQSVRINPFAAILALFLGGMALGPMGMVLAIPLLAIIKVLCDNIDSLNSIGFLMGEPPE